MFSTGFAFTLILPDSLEFQYAVNGPWVHVFRYICVFISVYKCYLISNDRFQQSADYVIARALAAGVQKMVVTGNRLNASRSAIVMAKTRPNILYASVGIHPHFVKDDFNDRSLEAMKELVNSPEVVCVGEIGLDFNRDYSPREDQKKAFEKQVCMFVVQLNDVVRQGNLSMSDVLFSSTLTIPIGHPQEVLKFGSGPQGSLFQGL